MPGHPGGGGFRKPGLNTRTTRASPRRATVTTPCRLPSVSSGGPQWMLWLVARTQTDGRAGQVRSGQVVNPFPRQASHKQTMMRLRMRAPAPADRAGKSLIQAGCGGMWYVEGKGPCVVYCRYCAVSMSWARVRQGHALDGRGNDNCDAISAGTQGFAEQSLNFLDFGPVSRGFPGASPGRERGANGRREKWRMGSALQAG